MSFRRHQRGITLVMIAIAMLALIAVAGLALDVGHLTVNQARLQSTLDAAAVSGAKVLDNTGSTAEATTAVINTFTTNAANVPELGRAGITPTVEFSNTAVPFDSGSVRPLFVRVQTPGTGFQIPATLSRVLGFGLFQLRAQAVAGPSPTLSNAGNLTPLMMCGTVATPAFPVYGYYVSQVVALQLSSGTPQASPGNYLTLSSGVYSEDQDFGGAYAAWSTVGSSDVTSTGTVPAPVAQGLDTRFDEYLAGDLNSATYPPDVIITQPAGTDHLQCSPTGCAAGVQTAAGVQITNASQLPNYSYEGMYLSRVQAANYDIPPAPAGIGVVNRRVLSVPVGNCAVANPGGGAVPVIGFACLFTLQDVDPTTGQVFGEVLPSCQVNGTPAARPNNAPGPYSIQLYHVAGSPQS